MEIPDQCEKARNELEKTGVMNLRAAQAAPSATRAPYPSDVIDLAPHQR